MKCHYEVLNVPQDAELSEIKSAYKKLALKWHPDKNLDNTDLAKEQFQLVQQAYEVLSDKQERAWYDKHREQILHGADTEFEDNSLNVFQYFGNCFKGYGDDENGFYTTYRIVFEKIAKEDLLFMESKEEFCDIPNFGMSSSPYEEVAKFYAHWTNYCTKKSFVWLDPYNIKDIRDRKYLKLAEKENKKIRQQAKKERNEEVRNLVAFVCKRDKRVQAQKKLIEQKQLENKKKREELTQKKKLERQQELNNHHVQPDWAKFHNFKSELEEIEKNIAEEFGDNSSSYDSENEEDFDSLYCIACNKKFKTPKAFENHESSKKHKENVDRLKITLQNDESSDDCEENTNESDHIDCSNLNTIDTTTSNNGMKTNDNEDPNLFFNENTTDIDEMHADFESVMGKKLKKSKKQKKVISISPSSEIDNDSFIAPTVDSDDDFCSDRKQKKKKGKNKSSKVNNVDMELSEENNLSKNKTLEKEKTWKEDKPDKPRKKIKNSVDNLNDIDFSHSCVTCKSIFPSKNKLFDHLKKTGHSVYLDPQVKNKKKCI